ncbi:glycosyltransferase family 2 protein [Martelella alba]|uniref:Glycosyltransferase family 2 protein n=1 Tax=Martelella alba TaxID=2590451 RepID=A0A506UGD2_9HYPH|nr:glycosyltransferase family A protein [Martelella alba]TPW32099.1 glycosyltransferase family 2 protein [Martelella alba]
MPKISIVVPCYNAEKTIAATLTSALDQSFQDFEVIVVDDGSTDGTVSVVDGFVQKSHRVRLYSQTNAGPSAARNRAVFELARGELIAFLDADDIWPMERLAIFDKRFAAADAPDLAYGRVAFFSRSVSDVEARSSVSKSPLTVADLIAENETCTMSNIVAKRQVFLALGGFDPGIVHGEDVEWLVRLAAKGARIEGIDTVLTCYRASRGGLSSDLPAMRQSWNAALASASKMNVALSNDEIKAAKATHLRYLARRALRLECARGTALKLVTQALWLSPRGFFRHRRRGVLTLAAAMVEALSPRLFNRMSQSQ